MTAAKAVRELATRVSEAETPEEAKNIVNELAPEIDFEDKVCLLHNYQVRMVVDKSEFSRAMIEAMLMVLRMSRENRFMFANEFSRALTEVCQLERESE